MIARIRLVLPTPLRPSTQVHRADLGVDDDAAQGMAGAVIEVDVLDVQHRLSAPDRLR